VLLDGNSLSIPNIGGRFFARTGSVGIQGYPMPGRQGRMQLGNPTGSPWIVGQDNVNISGYVDESIISNHDLSNAAHRVQYVPETQVASPDADDKPPAPTALTVTGESGFNAIRVTPPARSTYDFVEVWASIDNNRANAVRIGRGDVSEFKHELPVLAARWYWSRDGAEPRRVDARRARRRRRDDDRHGVDDREERRCRGVGLRRLLARGLPGRRDGDLPPRPDDRRSHGGAQFRPGDRPELHVAGFCLASGCGRND
jgi:hypothetical protein